MKLAISLIRFVLTLLFIIVLVFNLGLLVSGYLLDEDPPQIMGYSVIDIDSHTGMEPTLMTGDALILHGQPQYDMGEVVGFFREGELMVRRIVGYNSEGFITQGDRLPETDPVLLYPREILGLAVLQVPGFGIVVNWLTSPFGTVTLIIAWLLLIGLPMLIENPPKKKEKKK